MRKQSNKPDGSDTLFLIAALSLVVGVPTALYTIYFFADSVELVAALVLMAILVVCLSGYLVVRYRDRIISYVSKVPANIADAGP